MTRLESLLASVKDPELRAQLAKEVRVLKDQAKFGLVFERHLPENIRLASSVGVKPGEQVRLRKAVGDDRQLTVKSVTKTEAVVVSEPDGEQQSVALRDLLVLKSFNEPVFPTLKSIDSITDGGDKPPHLVIEADNFHALQLLALTHPGQVDCIYIDPPYNTGNEKAFKYNDRFVGADDAFRHSKWLSFMEGRLRLAHELLADDGAILISIDDNEVATLRLLCNQIFGAQNFVASFTWDGGRKNDAQFVSDAHDYVLAYAKSKGTLVSRGVRWMEDKDGIEDIYAQVAKLKKAHKDDYEAATTGLKEWFAQLPKTHPAREHKHYWHIDSRGAYFAADMSSPNPRPNLTYDYKGYKPPDYGWRYELATMKALDEDDRIHYPDSKDKRLQLKRYLRENETQVVKSVFNKDRRGAEKALTTMMGAKVFRYPKDVDVLKRLIGAVIAGKHSATVLDFFAGSGTTGQAIAEMNAKDGGTRQAILVTNNEVERDVAEKLATENIFPGDPAYEAEGLFEQVTKPRITTAMTGIRPDGSVYREGLNENVEFLRLDFLDDASVELGLEQDQLKPLQWLAAGARGPIEQKVQTGEGFEVTAGAGYAVLLNEVFFGELLAAIADRPDIEHVFLSTLSDDAFAEMSSQLPDRTTHMLPREYLEFFRAVPGKRAS